MKKTIGVFAHVDAGKTTFSEQLLYKTNTIRKLGRVDNKDAFLDSHFIERERGITIYSDIGKFNYNNNEYYLVDTPGHVDFSPEMERAVGILDYAILLISAVEGIQAHTETLWKLLRDNGIPTFIFVNKIDREGADEFRVFQEIKRNLSENVIKIREDELENPTEELVEFLSDRDEELLELYLSDIYNKEQCKITLKNLIKKQQIFPCFFGSALLDIGLEEFLKVFDCLTDTNYSSENREALSGQIHKIRYDKDGNRITFIKLITGEIHVKDTVSYFVEGEELLEKVNAIRLYSGEKFINVDSFGPGDICGVIGLSKLKPGMVIGKAKELKFSMVPTLASMVIFDNKINPKEVLKFFRLLEAEEGSLNVSWKEAAQEITINIMGEIQLEIIKELCLERFNLKVDFAEPMILYKETIVGSVMGYGHFEPLKHYAEVHLKLEELPYGSGVQFENKCHTDNMTIGNMNLVKTHIFEKEHKGILTGSPITDIKITLINGRAHNKHTEGGDFREATKRALRQGLEYAENILLEPYYNFTLEGDINNMGRFMSDIERLKGNFEPPSIIEDRVLINGTGPVETFRRYPLEVQALSKGKARISLIFKGYLPCHNQVEVIEKMGYDRNKDSEYTACSIFCSKGQAFSVSAENAKEYMHISIE